MGAPADLGVVACSWTTPHLGEHLWPLRLEPTGHYFCYAGSGDRLLLGRRDEALVAVGARDENLAAVGADTAGSDAAVMELSDVEPLQKIGGAVLERARPRRCGGTDLE